MLINWFTVIAQIINFLILAVLLKRFLYGPIIKAMDEREAGIMARFADAEKKGEEAEQKAATYQQKVEEIEDQRQELLEKVGREIEEQRNALRRQAHQEIEELRKRWSASLQREKNAFLLDLRQQVCKQVLNISRSAFKDLSNIDLERHLLEVFVKRLEDLPEEERQKLAASISEAEKVVVITSAFDVPEDLRQRIIQVMKARIGEGITARFETSPALITGIELRADGYKVAWSLENYLQGIEENLAGVFTEEAMEKMADNP